MTVNIKVISMNSKKKPVDFVDYKTNKKGNKTMKTKIKSITLNTESEHYEDYSEHNATFHKFIISHCQLSTKQPSGYEKYYHNITYHIKDFFKYKCYGNKNSAFFDIKRLIKGLKYDIQSVWNQIRHNIFTSKIDRYNYELVGVVYGLYDKQPEHDKGVFWTYPLNHLEMESYEMDDLFIIELES